MPGARRAGVVAAGLVWAATLSGCSRKHVPVDLVPELGYPACGDAGADEPGVLVAFGHLRSGPLSAEQNVAERFDLRRTSCGFTLRSRQEWPLSISDVEVRYDASLSPVWAWKRMTLAGSRRADGDAEVRRYELRTGEVFIKRRDARGQTSLERLLAGGRTTSPAGARVGVVIAPGRGGLTAWLRRARLPVGGRTQDLVLDFRAPVESLEVGALERQPDQVEPDYGRAVRVYTFFGREAVFADDQDTVIGDLAGMRPSDRLASPEPPAMPTFGGPDPVHTP